MPTDCALRRLKIFCTQATDCNVIHSSFGVTNAYPVILASILNMLHYRKATATYLNIHMLLAALHKSFRWYRSCTAATGINKASSAIYWTIYIISINMFPHDRQVSTRFVHRSFSIRLLEFPLGITPSGYTRQVHNFGGGKSNDFSSQIQLGIHTSIMHSKNRYGL